MIADLVHSVGFGICHQATARSFEAGGLQFPVCARCTGIYTGFVFGLVALFVLYRQRHRIGRFSWLYIGFAVGAVLFMGLDGVSSYLGLRVTTNAIRLLTGVLFGASIAPVAYLILIESLASRWSGDSILAEVPQFAQWTLASLFGVVFVYASLWSGPAAALVQVVFILVTFGLVLTALVGVHPRYERSVQGIRQAIEPVAIGMAGGCLIVLGCAVIRYLLGG